MRKIQVNRVHHELPYSTASLNAQHIVIEIEFLRPTLTMPDIRQDLISLVEILSPSSSSSSGVGVVGVARTRRNIALPVLYCAVTHPAPQSTALPTFFLLFPPPIIPSLAKKFFEPWRSTFETYGNPPSIPLTSASMLCQ